MKSAYEIWSVDQFEGPLYVNPNEPFLPPQTVSNARLLGTRLNVWNDHPNFRREATIASEIVIPMHVIAQKGWGSPLLAPRFSTFQRIIQAIGEPPLP